MNLYLENYNSKARIAKVLVLGENKDIITNNGEEWLFFDGTQIIFSSDGYKQYVSNDLLNRFQSLKSGDIISIDEQGLIYRLFSVEENDATIFMTGHCNSNCIMCPASDNERRYNGGLEEATLKQYIEMLPDDIEHIVVTGGEPTLRLDLFFEVMKRTAERFPDLEVLLLTNGRSLAAKTVVDRLMQHCPAYLKVAIPVHGHVPDLHDEITQAQGSFMQTCTGIKQMLYKKVRVELRVVVTKKNYTYLSAIAELIAKQFKTVEIVNFIGLETRGNCAKNFREVYFDHNEAFPYIKEAINILVTAGIDTSIYNFPLCTVERGYWHLCRKSISPEKVRFAADCVKCEAIDYCGGFFDTTLSMTKPMVKPIYLKAKLGVD